jgi:hypothetical protein
MRWQLASALTEFSPPVAGIGGLPTRSLCIRVATEMGVGHRAEYRRYYGHPESPHRETTETSTVYKVPNGLYSPVARGAAT